MKNKMENTYYSVGSHLSNSAYSSTNSIHKNDKVSKTESADRKKELYLKLRGESKQELPL